MTNIKQIKTLELESMELEPSKNQRNQWDAEVLAYAHRFIDTLGEAKAYETDLKSGDRLLDHPIEEEGKSLSEILDFYSMTVDTPGLNPASAGHLGYIPGGGIYASALGDYMAAVGNRYGGIYYGSPGAVQMEHAMIRWMCDIFELGPEAGGTLCSGGSIANLTAIITARDAQNLRPSQYEKAVIYLSAQVHHCVLKALRIAGLEYSIIRNIPLDDKDRMDPVALREQISMDKKSGLNPLIIVASAGTTDTGAIDPLEAIGLIANSEKIWYHIDAAYGGFFKLLPECNELLKGISLADSIVVDPHKGLFLPYGLGALLVKDVQLLRNANYYLANYMQDAYRSEVPMSPADLSPELTRHFRALRLWLPMMLHGIRPFRAALKEKLLLAEYAAEQLLKIVAIELRNAPELSVVCFRIKHENLEKSNALNLGLTDYIKEDGKVFLSSTIIEGVVYVRMAILCFRTHLETVDYALLKIREFVENAEM